MSNKLLRFGAAAAFVITGATAIGAGNANAVGGNCSSSRETKSHIGPDEYRVRASCASLQADSKARGVLDINLANDYETVWFTALNTSKYSGYTYCIYPNTCNNTYVRIAHV